MNSENIYDYFKCPLWVVACHSSNVNKSVWLVEACKTHVKAQRWIARWRAEVSRVPMKADAIVIFYYPQYHQRRDSTNCSHLNFLFIAWPHAKLWYLHCQYIGDFIVLLYIYNHRTSDNWAQCSDIYLFITIWDFAVLFELRHQYFRKGTSILMMIWSKYTITWTQWIWDHVQNGHRCCSIRKSFCRTINSGQWAVVWYRKKVARMFSHTSLAGNFGRKYRCPTAILGNLGQSGLWNC